MGAYGSAKKTIRAQKEAAHEWADPYMEFAGESATPWLQEAHDAAQLPAMRGAYQGVIKSLSNRMARQGLQGSGIAEEATRNANVDYMQAKGNAGMQKAGMLGALAGQSFGMGQAGYSAVNQALQNAINLRLNKLGLETQQGMADQQALAGMGGAVGQGLMSILPYLLMG